MTSRLFGALERWATERPNDAAVTAHDGTHTFVEVADRVRHVSAALRAHGVDDGDVVGLTSGRTRNSLSDLLAIWSVGATAALLDPRYPADRLAFMLKDAGAHHLLGPALPAGAVPRGVRPVGTEDAVISSPSPAETSPTNRPDGIAYLVYTSGTTGWPKGVEIGYDNLGAYLDALATLEIGVGGAGVNAVSPAFDGWLWCTTLYLLFGQTMHLIDTTVDDVDVATRIATVAPRVVCLTPSLLAQCADLSSAEVVVAAGEPCPPRLVERFASGRRFLNVYGPTETTIAATWSDTARGDDARTIGRPLPGYLAAVRPDGELWIGGPGVARGYRNQPQLTADHFVHDADGVRWYRTGDRARIRPDGQIEHLGRVDDQVKVRGFRVELGEIESVVLAETGVQSAAAFVTRQDAVAVAVVADRGTTGDLADRIADRCRDRLPAHAVPSLIHTVDRLPRTTNGKLDRDALTALDLDRETASTPIDQLSPREQEVARIWADVLGHRVTDVHADFFDVGGHSLLAARLIAALHDATGARLPMRGLLTDPTIAGLASALDGADAERSAS